jgi:hypothetical protein
VVFRKNSEAEAQVMRRPKLQILQARHAGLREHVIAMFNTCWPGPAVKELIEAQFGETLSLATVERSRRRHWEGQRAQIRRWTGVM